MAEDKDALVAQVQELRSQLLPQMERDRALTRAEGRPWSEGQWLSGEPSLHKYPAGPAFLPLGRLEDVTAWTGIVHMNAGEWMNAALGSAALYAAGFGSGALDWAARGCARGWMGGLGFGGVVGGGGRRGAGGAWRALLAQREGRGARGLGREGARPRGAWRPARARARLF